MNRKFNTSEFIEKSKKIHGNKYDYSISNYIDSHKKIEVICLKHGKFQQTANSHLCGSGCPKCINIISKSETEFLDYMKIPQIEGNRQKHIKPYKVDGYDLETNTVYEFLGDYWHGNPIKFNSNDYNLICHRTFGDLYKETFDKLGRLKKMGYNVKYIWENDWEKFRKKETNTLSIITF